MKACSGFLYSSTFSVSNSFIPVDPGLKIFTLKLTNLCRARVVCAWIQGCYYKCDISQL